MGSHSSKAGEIKNDSGNNAKDNKKPEDSAIDVSPPAMRVDCQMHCILMYWLRNTPLINDCTFPPDLFHLIVHTYCYQEIFETERQHKSKDPQKYQRLNNRGLVSGFHSMDIMLLGDTKTGKHKLVDRYCHDTFDPQEDGNKEKIDSTVKRMYVEDNEILLQIWHPTADARHLAIGSFLQSMHGIMYVYDMTRAESVAAFDDDKAVIAENANVWKVLDDIAWSLSQMHEIVVGTKSDLLSTDEMRQSDFVAAQMASQFAKKHKIADCIETSAKNGGNVREAFEMFTAQILHQRMNRAKRIQFPFHG